MNAWGMYLALLLPLVVSLEAAWSAPPAGPPLRTDVRLLYGFETARDVSELRRRAENLQIETVQDNGVTEGRNCARVVVRKGAGYAELYLGAPAIKDWSRFDYFAVDVFTEDEHAYPMYFELWDGLSKNYSTRCTIENVRTHQGRQTLLYQINRAKRNGKEGREWAELEPKDKIQMNGLTRVKLFTTPRKDRDAVFWIDNLRLLQEDAAKPKLRVPLPASAIAFDFGSPGAVVPRFHAVSAQTRFAATPGFGFVATDGLQQAGAGWPDRLTGTFVMAADGRTIQFHAKVPNGAYDVWLSAGKIIRPDLKHRRFELQLNDRVLCREEPTWAEFCSENYLYRFLSTQYSEKPHAVWTNYVNRMYPSERVRIRVSDGMLKLTATNHFVSALIAVPAKQESESAQLATDLRDLRIAAFEKTYFSRPRKKPSHRPADGSYLLYVPDDSTNVMPWTEPSDAERSRKQIRTAAASGQSVTLRVAVTPFADLGRCELRLSDLRGPATVAASNIRGYFKNYRSDGASVGEMALLPSLTPTIERGVSLCFWLRMDVPDDAPAGTYRGKFTFRPENGAAVAVPVECEVYPFRLQQSLPVSYGMYYHRRGHPAFPPEEQRRLYKEQLRWMRGIGFTAVSVGGPTVTSVRRGSDQVSMRFDPLLYELAREVGMARRPEQMLMASGLGVGRAIGRRLPGSLGAKVDQNPGIELRQPGFQAYFLNALRQYRTFLDKVGLPVAIEVVDEPRETPNPWNRNLADTIAYAKLWHQVPGLRTFVTPMSDGNAGKNYTVLADHVDIVSIHAWQRSAGLLRRTREQQKRLWLYNTGMDRFSWGFYNWRVKSVGRWEWHFCFPDNSARGGYPGREWYNPFTGLHGLAPNAPFHKYPGGMLFQSRFLRVAEGVNDYAYLVTIEAAIRARKASGKNAATVKRAEEFLAALERVIPELPGLKGLGSAGDGALVGLGIDDGARRHLSDWRQQIAGFLKELN